jgi:hypothetical protein
MKIGTGKQFRSKAERRYSAPLRGACGYHACMHLLLYFLLLGAQTRPVPKPPDVSLVRATVVTDKASFFLGESVPVRYCLDNISQAPFDAWFASSPQRFTTVVSDERGAVVAKPAFTLINPDEMSFPHSINPGDRYCQQFELTNYARLDKPGLYTVATTYEFVNSWVIGNTIPRPKVFGPEARTTLTILNPTKADAEKVVAATGVWSRLLIRPGVYLEPLLDAVRSGNLQAIQGIASIASPEATRALLNLLDDSRPEVRRDAASALTARVPDALQGTLGTLGGFGSDRELVAGAWRPEFAPELRTKARKLLAATVDEWTGRAGAFILASIGEPEDIPDIASALNGALLSRGLAQELTRAAEGIVGLGYVPSMPSERPGDQVVWLLALARGARPIGWESALAKILDAGPTYVKDLAVRRMPVPAPDSVLASIGSLLEQSDSEVLANTCGIVQRQSLVTLRPRAMSIFRTTSNDSAFRSCGYAVLQLGPRMEYYEVLLSRLTEEGRTASVALSSLLGVFEGTTGGGSRTTIPAGQARLLAQRWRAFMDRHRADLEAGRKLSLDLPDATGDLVPEGWNLFRDGKPQWP